MGEQSTKCWDKDFKNDTKLLLYVHLYYLNIKLSKSSQVYKHSRSPSLSLPKSCLSPQSMQICINLRGTTYSTHLHLLGLSSLAYAVELLTGNGAYVAKLATLSETVPACNSQRRLGVAS
jgi:hypothetical protein